MSDTLAILRGMLNGEKSDIAMFEVLRGHMSDGSIPCESYDDCIKDSQAASAALEAAIKAVEENKRLLQVWSDEHDELVRLQTLVLSAMDVQSDGFTVSADGEDDYWIGYVRGVRQVQAYFKDYVCQTSSNDSQS